MIEVTRTVYQTFYKIVNQKFLEKALKGVVPKNGGVNSPQIWTLNEKLASELFKGHSTSGSTYFYRKNSLFNKKTNSVMELDSLAMIKGLRYIGVKIPKNAGPYNEKDDDLVAKLLLEEFTKKYRILEKAHSISKETIKKADSAPPSKYPNISINEQNSVEATLVTFYDRLYRGDEAVKEAWDMLTLRFQERWNGVFEKFRVGYTTTSKIDNMHAFDFTKIDDRIDCKFFYEDEIRNYSCSDLDNIYNLNVSSIDQFVRHVNSFREKMKVYGSARFEDIPLRKLFDPTSGEYIWTVSQLDPKKLGELFTHRETKNVFKLVKCSCVNIDGVWMIDWIEGTPAYSNQ